MADPSSNTKKYTPPSQRNLSGGNRKTGVFKRNMPDRAGSQQNKDGERGQTQATGSQMEKASQKIITLKDCATSEAYQLLSQRWATAMHQYNDPTVDLSERPIMYYGGSVWGKLPHQILASANNTLPPKISPADYRAEVRRGLLTPRT